MRFDNRDLVKQWANTETVSGDPVIQYLPAIASLLLGICAFFYSEEGARKPIGGVGWALLILLVIGGLANLFVLRSEQVAKDAASELARTESKKVATLAAKHSALTMTLIGDFDLRQNIDGANFLFEFPFASDGSRARVPPSFDGPFPKLPQGAQGRLVLNFGDFAYRETWFEWDGERDRAIAGPQPEALSAVSEPCVFGGENGSAASRWCQQIEPPSSRSAGGWVFATRLNIDQPLRRLLYNLISLQELGAFYIPAEALGDEAREMLLEGFRIQKPLLVFHIAETDPDIVCDSYLHVPFEIFHKGRERLENDGTEWDVYAIRLTEQGFAPDPCNNDPI